MPSPPMPPRFTSQALHLSKLHPRPDAPISSAPILPPSAIQSPATHRTDRRTPRRGPKSSKSNEQRRLLTAELTLKPYAAGTHVVFIDEAHLLTPEAQNALLNLLEESPGRTLIVLVAEQPEALLLTVRSRCRMVHF